MRLLQTASFIFLCILICKSRFAVQYYKRIILYINKNKDLI